MLRFAAPDISSGRLVLHNPPKSPPEMLEKERSIQGIAWKGEGDDSYTDLTESIEGATCQVKLSRGTESKLQFAKIELSLSPDTDDLREKIQDRFAGQNRPRVDFKVNMEGVEEPISDPNARAFRTNIWADGAAAFKLHPDDKERVGEYF